MKNAHDKRSHYLFSACSDICILYTQYPPRTRFECGIVHPAPVRSSHPALGCRHAVQGPSPPRGVTRMVPYLAHRDVTATHTHTRTVPHPVPPAAGAFSAHSGPFPNAFVVATTKTMTQEEKSSLMMFIDTPSIPSMIGGGGGGIFVWLRGRTRELPMEK